MNKLHLLLLISLLLATLACAPQAAPPPSTLPPAQTPAILKATPPPALSPDKTALQKLVDAAKKEGSVTLYSFNMVGDVGLAMQRAFKEQYGINVDIITGRGAEFAERLKTEARSGSRTGDFVEGAAAHIINIKNMGLTIPLKDLPVLQEKDVWKMDPLSSDIDSNVIVAYPIFQQPFANTRLVKPEEEPKSWFDILQPKWKGKILFTDPVVSANAYLVFQPLVRAGVLTEDYLQKLGAQDLIFVTGPPQAIERLARGEAPLFVGAQPASASNAVREGAPIKIFDCKEGMSAQAVVQAVVKDAPHTNAAKLFANWWLSKEGQSVYSKAKGAATIRKDVPSGLPPSLDVDPVKPIYNTSEDLDIQAKMFRDKVWVPLLKKGK